MRKPGRWRKGLAVVTTLVTLLSTLSAVQAGYRVELDGSYAQTTETLADADNINLSAEVFLHSVEDGLGPLGEAAFLSRASSLLYRYDRTESDSDVFTGGFFSPSPLDPVLVVPSDPVEDFANIEGSLAENIVSETHSVQARYVFPVSGWIYTLGGQRTAPQSIGFGDEEGYGVNIGVGRYLDSTTTLEFTAGFARQDFATQSPLSLGPLADLPLIDFQGILINSTTETDTFSGSLQLRRVGKIGRETFATTLLIGYAETELEASSSSAVFVDSTGEEQPFDGFIPTSVDGPTVESYNALAAATWFVTRSLGIDVGYTYNRALTFDVHGVDAGAGWFVSPNIELRGNYRRSFPELGPDTGEWRATLRARF